MICARTYRRTPHARLLCLWDARNRWVPRPNAQTHFKEQVMNKDQVKGRAKQTEGKVKEAAGKLVGNSKLEQKGKAENVVGKVQAAYGDIKNDIKKSD
jgi:uncharacterized protein YjbJ (UPF0337 family)